LWKTEKELKRERVRKKPVYLKCGWEGSRNRRREEKKQKLVFMLHSEFFEIW